METKETAEQIKDYIIERRRYYHSHPELPGEEKNTRIQLKKDLEAMGITDIREMKNSYGMIAEIYGSCEGKTIGLRTDIDALKIEEKTGLPYASVNKGVMHACGHDSHMAMLLGAAKILNSQKDKIHGNVRLIFQSEEEKALGATKLMREGAVDGIDAIYGIHIWGTFDAPYFDFSLGNRMACCHKIIIDIYGKTAHGSAPYLGVDAITVSSAIINALQQCVSRQNDSRNPLVITIGSIHGGVGFNSIANHVVMEGTVRTFSTGQEVEERMRKIINCTAEAFGATAELEYIYMTDAVINRSEKLNQIAENAVEKLYGKQCLNKLNTLMSSEDFSLYGRMEIPYIFGFIGARNRSKGLVYTNHHEKFDVDEEVLPMGSAVMAQFAIDYLKES